MNEVFIGTSGWSYNHWQNTFYPPNLKKQEWLKYYARYFSSVEVNSTFYHLPREQTVKNWVATTPPDFLFAVKASRYITHLKQLKDPRKTLVKHWALLLLFPPKLGPVLFQFSPKFVKKTQRLKEFLRILSQGPRPSSSTSRIKFCVEFRHSSWFCQEVYEILQEHNIALCFSDTPQYPYQEEITANFVYLRLHGHKKLYASKYTQKQLQDYARKIKKWQDRIGNVYCYFDNDAFGFAVQNAKELQEILS